MNEKTQQLVKKYFDIILARKMLLVTLVFIAVLGGLVQYYKTPKIYQATSLLIYEKKAINPSKMSPDVKDMVKEVVSTLMQQVTSRSSLEKIIKDLNLYPEMLEKMPLEDVIESMRKVIKISPTKGEVFQVSFSGGDPKKVLRVTNALASKFIEENLKYREERASETSSYIANELQLSKQSLDKKEQAMRDYKLKYYNELPEQRQINVARADTLQVKLQGVQDNIQELERTKLVLKEQIGQRRQLLQNASSNMVASTTEGKDVPGGDPYQKLAQMHAYLDTLLVKYKETHPEVKRIRKSIAALETQLSANDNVGTEEKEGSRPSTNRSLMSRDPVLQAAAIQQRDLERNLVVLRVDEKELRSQIQKLEEWIAAAPVREAEWSALTRDYNQFKSHYDFLVSQNLQASSVENLEKKQQGSQFKIMDPARLPQKPVKPDFMKIMVLAIGLGCALGGGLALGLDLLDTSFKDPLEIEEYLGVSVACSVPYLPLPKEKKLSRLKSIGFILYFITGLAIITAALYYLWSRGIVIL
ncbi:GNVR domain-containing protein [Desulfogranum marinum]|uniref:GumC family protein n=1 Tax=Desulfogranum marinum TaxID=453220 RepID=UPI0029C84B4B|nr:GNVR domain-containing protein [Desulfogranum marinum]